MKSTIWKIDFIEAYKSGYSKSEIESFITEAELLLRQLVNHFKSLNGRYSANKKDKNLLVYLILNELIHSLYDAVLAIQNGNIRMTSRVFREVMECRDIIKLVHSENGEKYVDKWFKDEYIPHSDFRKTLENDENGLKDLTRDIYQKYSKYTHRSYSAIIDSFTLENDKLKFNMNLDIDEPLHRKIISKYCIHTAQFILNTGLDPLEYNLISEISMGMIVNNMMEEK
ncbi:hypothetical protein [Polaribacter atrinae]|uniref:hypothetical protein n=1 Tax=Polaribacter atrinae TaxID=1333662 RepID=UPI00249342CE|nr:hypothetical protein [Polaribacter atrinae]